MRVRSFPVNFPLKNFERFKTVDGSRYTNFTLSHVQILISCAKRKDNRNTSDSRDTLCNDKYCVVTESYVQGNCVMLLSKIDNIKKITYTTNIVGVKTEIVLESPNC